MIAVAHSPDLAAAMRLLDAAKDQGFTFQRVAPGEDGPLFGVRESFEWRDTIYLGGFGQNCHASRAKAGTRCMSVSATMSCAACHRGCCACSPTGLLSDGR